MLRRVASIVVATMALGIWLGLFLPVTLGGSAGYIIVSGVSMEPTLYTGDLVITRRYRNYHEGDIVAFQADGGIVIHRIVGGSADDGYVMLGDNKESIDGWRPKPENIIGRQWIHIPGIGNVLNYLRAPLPLGLIVTAFLATSFGGKRGFNRRRMGRNSIMKSRQHFRMRLHERVWKLAALATVTVLVLLFGALAVYSLRQPTEVSIFDESLAYEHTVSVDYVVHTDESTVYPDGTIGPVTADEAPTDSSAQTTPIFTQLARRIDLDVSYALDSSELADVQSTMKIDLLISSVDGWQKTFELAPSSAFNGGQTTKHVTIDVAEVIGLIETIEEETDFRPGAYDVSVIPTVAVSGSIGNENIDDDYTPMFTMEFSGTQITPPAELLQRGPRSIGSTIIRSKHLAILGLNPSVQATRWVGMIGFGLSLTAASALAAVVFLGVGRSASRKIHARYRSLLVAVTNVPSDPDAQMIDVESIDELVRLARRDGRIILHHECAPGVRRYFVPDLGVTYQYLLDESPRMSTPTRSMVRIPGSVAGD